MLEDDFAHGRPPWEDAGVLLLDDVVPYELVKLRLLNASHQAPCHPGHLTGRRLVHEVCRGPAFAGYRLTDLDHYRRKLISRFSDGSVRDTVVRLCAESSDRIPKWLVPVIRENLTAGRSVRYGAAMIATWARYAEGIDEDGAPVDVVDRLRERVLTAAAQNRTDPLAFLRQRQLFLDLVDQPEFVEAYLEPLETLHDEGAAALVTGMSAPR